MDQGDVALDAALARDRRRNRHCPRRSSVALARVTNRSVKAKWPAAIKAEARISGAMIWCAEIPAAFIEMISLFWFNPAKVISVPSSTAKGRKRATSWGRRKPDVAPQLGVAIAGIGEDAARFAEQIEHHQDADQGDQDGGAAHQEQPHHVERDPARGEELQVDHEAARPAPPARAGPAGRPA